MKTQVHTLRYGPEQDWMKACVPSLENWCERHGYDLTVWDDSHGYDVPKFVEKEMVEHALKTGADQIIYIDADVYIRPDAPPFPAFRGIATATDQWHAVHEPHFHEWVAENFPKATQKAAEGWAYQNAGVWAADKFSAVELHRAMSRTPMVEFFQEQHWFNLCVAVAVSRGAEHSKLSSAWNRYGRDVEPSWFHHLWGDTKMEDFQRLKESGVLTMTPGLLRRNLPAIDPADPDKTIFLEFIQDAGLGNQMFEWAAAYSIAKTLNLPLRWVWKPSGLREFGLQAFGIGESARKAPYEIVMQRKGQGHRKLFEYALKVIQEHEGPYPAISCPFQAEECFIDHADDIRALYTPEKVDLPIPDGTTPVGVQVRRGDYMKHPTLNVTTPEYFTNAMKWMRERIGNPHFVIVSDDPEWCINFFGYREDTSVMPPQTAYEGIRTLASCEAHIISNSTFGWWGAWLGEKGPVVVPEKWHHREGAYGDWNPVPARWHRVSIGNAPRVPEVKPLSPVFAAGLPSHKRAIVYPWHADQEQWHELRYSLRSVHKYFEDQDCPIYILGTRRPGWATEAGRVKYIGAFTYREALTKGLQLGEEVLWMNDDVLFLKPTGWEDCRTTLYQKPIPPSFLENAPTQDNPWRQGVLHILKALAAEGIRDQKVFSTHTPYLFEREKALAILEKYGVWEKFPMEMAYFHHHAVSPTMLTTEKATGAPFGDARFLNFTDRLLGPALKQAIVEAFPERPPWEMDLNFGL